MRTDVKQLRAALADGAPPEQMADYLTDSDADLADILHLHAAAPPCWRGGLPVEVLSCWLLAHADPRGQQIAAMTPPLPLPRWKLADQSLMTLAYCFVGYLGEDGRGELKVPCPRCAAIQYDSQVILTPAQRTTSFLHLCMPDGRQPHRGFCGRCLACCWSLSHNLPEARNLKRRVLGLFPDVQVTLIRNCPDCDGGKLFCKRCQGRGWIKPGGKIRASDLIPPSLENTNIALHNLAMTMASATSAASVPLAPSCVISIDSNGYAVPAATAEMGHGTVLATTPPEGQVPVIFGRHHE